MDLLVPAFHPEPYRIDSRSASKKAPPFSAHNFKIGSLLLTVAQIPVYPVFTFFTFMIKMDDDDDEPQQQQQLSPPLLSAAQVDPSILASKRVVFIGGLPDEATATMVRAAMIPFGDIRSVDMVRAIAVR